MERVEVAVVGAGVMGAATAWALGRRGIDAVVIEQAEPGHGGGSSHGATRIFRFAYDDPFYVRMAMDSLPYWRELESVRGETLLRITGGLDFGSTDYLSTSAAALRGNGAAADIIDGDERKQRFPHVDYGNDSALYSPDTGILAAGRCVTGMADASRLPLRSGTRVTGLRLGDDDAVVETGGGAIAARRVVLTAGGWTGPILRAAGAGEPPLQVSREQVFYFRGGEDLPVVIERGGILRYLLPPAFGAAGAKAGEHGTGERTTAEGRSYAIDPEGEARVCDWIADAFPTLDAEPVAAETCLYTLTPDEDFLIDVNGPLIWASPCSGHGFKFAPLIGECLAALALGEEPPFDPSRFSPERFG